MIFDTITKSGIYIFYIRNLQISPPPFVVKCGKIAIIVNKIYNFLRFFIIQYRVSQKKADNWFAKTTFFERNSITSEEMMSLNRL